MPFQKPDNDVAFAATQSIWYSPEIDMLAAGIAGDGVVSGCAVTAQGTPDMTVAVAAGVVRIGGVLVNVAGGNVTITTANATNPRIDLVVVNNSGTKSVTAGTAAANPKMPAIPANSVVLADVTVPANDTTIASNQITDKRVIVGDALLAAANIFSAKQTIGSGDRVGMFYTNAGLTEELFHGSAATPVTAAGSTLKVSRTQAVTRATLTAATASTADGADVLAAISGTSVGTAADEVQPIGVAGFARNSGTYTGAGTGNDACGIYAVGQIQGSGVGVALGAAIYARAESATGKAVGIEVVPYNGIGSDSAYAPTAFTPISGIWINAGGNNDSGAAIQVGNAVGRQFEVGLAFNAQVTGGKTGGVRVATIRDDGNATTVLDINGTHTDGLDLSGATISGNSLSLPGSVIVSGAGNVGLGAAASASSRLYSFYSSNATSGQPLGHLFDAYLNAFATSTATMASIAASATLHSTATGTYTGAALRGGYFVVTNGHATLQLGIAQGFLAYVTSDGAGGINAARGAEIIINAASGATIATATGVLVNNASGAGSVTNQAGVAIDSLTKGTNNTHLLMGTLTIPSGNWGIYASTTADSVLAGKLGVGAVTAPTAALHIATSGTVGHIRMDGIAGGPASPAPGDVWYDTGQKAHRFRSTAGTGGLVGLLKAQTSIAGGDTVATTASETNFATNYAIPANGLTVGKTIYVYASGVYGTLGSGTVTLNLKVKMGTTALLNSAVITTAVSIAARFWKVEAYLTVTAVGASGALECRGEFRIPTANSDVGFSSPGIGGDATVTVDTTASQTVQISAQHGASSASNTIKMREFIVLELD